MLIYTGVTQERPSSDASASINDPAVAAALLVAAIPAYMPGPQLSESDDGEIGLSWLASGKRFEVMIDHKAVAWAVFDGTACSSGDQFDLDQRFQPRLLAALLAFLEPRP